MTVCLLVPYFTQSEAQEAYLSSFNLIYSSTSALSSELRCDICHPDGKNSLNSYGRDINKILKTKNVSTEAAKYALKWAEPLDSDGDGYSNIMEIKLGSHPGNKGDIPDSSLFEGHFRMISPMTTPRYLHSVAMFPDGRVLLTGGTTFGFEIQNSAETFDPKTNSFTKTGSMNQKRWNHTATTLKDGRVLIVGGADGAKLENHILKTAELYDPKTGEFAYTGELNYPRAYHTATLLPDGRVLIAGGGDSASLAHTKSVNTAEIYNPETGKFKLTDSMIVPRQFHRATLLNDGRILITGGTILSTTASMSIAEVFDPVKEEFVTINKMKQKRVAHVSTLLSDGSVLIAGGSYPRFQKEENSAEVFDPASNKFLPTGDMIDPMLDFIGILLDDGKVLVAGGARQGPVFKSGAELYDPEIEKFSFTDAMEINRDNFTPIKLRDGRVLVTGGVTDGFKFLSLAEVYVPNAESELEGIMRKAETAPEEIFSVKTPWYKKILFLKESSSSAKDNFLKELKNATGLLEKGDYSRMLKKVGLLRSYIRDDGSSFLTSKIEILKREVLRMSLGQTPITINAKASPESGNIPLEVKFEAQNDAESEEILSYFWDFGDGETSTEKSPKHTYTCPDDYNAALIVGTASSRTKEIAVKVKVSGRKDGVSYRCDVKPILDARCMGCHGASGGLSVISYADIMQGGENEEAVIPFKPEESSLVIRALENSSFRMPPRGDRVKKEEIKIIESWIKEGAKNN